MQLLDSYVGHPGHCRLCTSSETPVVDTERTYDSDGFGGALYICVNCGTDIAQLLDWVSPEKAKEKDDLAEDLLTRFNATEIQNEELQQRLDVLEKTQPARDHRPRKAR